MATPQAQSARNLRAIFRLSRTALHLTSGILTVALIYPFIKQDTRLALKQRWSRQLLTVLGIRLKVGAGDTPRSKYPWGAANNAMAAHPVGPAGRQPYFFPRHFRHQRLGASGICFQG
jgi:hypothetical protein